MHDPKRFHITFFGLRNPHCFRYLTRAYVASLLGDPSGDCGHAGFPKGRTRERGCERRPVRRLAPLCTQACAPVRIVAAHAILTHHQHVGRPALPLLRPLCASMLPSRDQRSPGFPSCGSELLKPRSLRSNSRSPASSRSFRPSIPMLIGIDFTPNAACSFIHTRRMTPARRRTALRSRTTRLALPLHLPAATSSTSDHGMKSAPPSRAVRSTIPSESTISRGRLSNALPRKCKPMRPPRGPNSHGASAWCDGGKKFMRQKSTQRIPSPNSPTRRPTDPGTTRSWRTVCSGSFIATTQYLTSSPEAPFA